MVLALGLALDLCRAAAAGERIGKWHYGQMIVPVAHTQPATPETRTLGAVEAEDALQRDWLFQAMGEPLAARAAKEIAWARELAARLAAKALAPELSAELAELAAIERRLPGLAGREPGAQPTKGADAPAIWIWSSEGGAAEGAPVEPRFFRRRFELPAGATVRRAELRIAADDACEVFVNGARVGAHDTWQRAAAFVVEKLIKGGANLLAVRAENRPAPVAKNPAGLIARLTISLADGQQVQVVSDASWRAEKAEPQGWQQPGFDDSGWKAAAIAAPFGGGPWGQIANLYDGAGGQADPAAAYAHEAPEVKAAYFAVRRVKRQIQLKNSILDFARLLLVDGPIPQGNVNPEHEAIHRMGISAVPGGRLLILDGFRPDGAVRLLAPAKPGSFWRPDISFDAKRVLFCYKPHDEKSFHLYETALDGTNLRQLTDSDYDDVDPLYMPDGHIIFTTTRGNSYVRCGPFIYSYILARCDADGRNVYLISLNGEPDFVPSLMEDGRVVYSRWEYTDKPLWRMQSLWTVNPDGTNVSVFWGNQSIWPDHQSQPRQIPGSRRVMFVGVGHHDWWGGSVGIIDPGKGFNFPDGLAKVTRDLPWVESGNGPVDPGESDRYHPSGKFTGYTSPYPLSERDFLVSARGAGGRFRLYVMDVEGNRELVYEGAHNILHAIPIRPRKVPPALPDRVVWPGTGGDRKATQPGTFFSPDVYQGVPDLPRGSVKYLRVFQQDHKTYSTWAKTWRNSGPAVSVVQEEAVKRILGEVPVEPDGSVYFTVPAGRSLYFQLLDEHYRCLQTMRSFSGVMPGERRGCLGCHEMHSATPPLQVGMAFRSAPRDLTPTPWGTESISYERFAQPVLDKYCGRCHQGEGEGRKKLDLTLRPGADPFKEPYLTLVGDAGWGTPARPGPGYGIAAAIPVESRGTYATIRPMTYLSYRSKLIERAMSGKHHDVKADALSLRRLIAWVDACCPYYGEEEIRALGDPDFPGIERLPIRPRVATAPRIERP
ncbi:MAG TPA: hypothetical protein VM389_13860 [Phycisphaerae bacterium]|nr:hypothetical protein [Phycisphaerae bacterium]